MSPSEYKTILHDTLRSISPRVLEQYVELVLASDDPETYRKFMLMSNDTLDAGVEKKIDPNANLPIFHINFLNGGMQGEVVHPLPMVDVVEARQAPQGLPLDPGAIEDLKPRRRGRPPKAKDKLLQELMADNPDLSDAC